MEHLSNPELQAFREGSLSVEQVLACGEHLAACDSCRATLAQELDAARRADELRESFAEDAEDEHLSYDETRLLAAGKLASERARSHVKECAQCAADVADMAAFLGDLAKTGREQVARPEIYRYAAIAAVALIAAFVGAKLFPAMLQKPAEVAVMPAPTPKVTEQTLSPEYAALVQQVKTEQRLPLAQPLHAAHDETLLGDAVVSTRFRLLTPVETVVTSDVPVFTWQVVAGATSYRVAVYDDEYRKITESGAVQGTSWCPTTALLRGRAYKWSVTASTNHGAVRSPAPPQPEAEFRVMDAVAAAKLTSARAEYPNEALLLAALYAQAGDAASAREQLHKLAAQQPGSPLAGTLEQSLPKPR